MGGMVTAIMDFHLLPKYEVMNFLLCSLRIMASDGEHPDGACNNLAELAGYAGGPFDNHFFGAYFGNGVVSI